jgi:hypothetical protein
MTPSENFSAMHLALDIAHLSELLRVNTVFGWCYVMQEVKAQVAPSCSCVMAILILLF